MALLLPEPATEKLARSPLSLVVCQVRHENKVLVEPKVAVTIHEALTDEFPILEEHVVQELAIAASPIGIQAGQGQATRGWRMKTKDQAWTAVVMPDFFALETAAYDDWSDFHQRFRGFAKVVSEAIAPAIEQRIGLRMIDRVALPQVTSPAQWKDWIAAPFLGPLADARFAEAVVGSQNVVQIDDSGNRSVLLRYGCMRDPEAGGKWVYLLDHDCFSQRARSFDLEKSLSEIEELHKLALAVFQSVITPDLYEYLKVTE